MMFTAGGGVSYQKRVITKPKCILKAISFNFESTNETFFIFAGWDVADEATTLDLDLGEIGGVAAVKTVTPDWELDRFVAESEFFECGVMFSFFSIELHINFALFSILFHAVVCIFVIFYFNSLKCKDKIRDFIDFRIIIFSEYCEAS